MVKNQTKKEVWRNVKGFEGYQVSNLGRVRNKSGRLLTPTVQGRHAYIRMRNDGETHKLRVEEVRKQSFSK